MSADTQAGSWRLGHLAVDQGSLGLRRIAGRDDAGLGHFEPEIVAFAGALADAGEDREAAVIFGDVIDQLHDDDGLANARAAEEANLAALQKGLDEVDDLDAGLEHFFLGRLLIEGRSAAVDRHTLLFADGAKLVHRLTDDVEHAAERFAADGRSNLGAEIFRVHATHHAVGGGHGDGADTALAEVLLHFEDHVNRRGHGEALAGDANRLIDRRHVHFFETARPPRDRRFELPCQCSSP